MMISFQRVSVVLGFLLFSVASTSSTPLSSNICTTTLYLRHQEENVAVLEQLFWEVSDPLSPAYAQHLPFEHVVELQRPSPEHIRAVQNYVGSLGERVVSFDFTRAMDKAVLKHHCDRPPFSASSANAVPASVAEAIEFFSSTSLIGRRQPSLRHPASLRARAATKPRSSALSGGPQDCLRDRAVPPCLRKAYGLNHTTAGNNTDNGQCVVVNEYYLESDLHQFQHEYNLPKQSIHNVGVDQDSAGTEASLDVQYITAMGSLVNTSWVYIDGTANNPFDRWLVWASNHSKVPLVHSLSVGVPENAFVQQLGMSAVERMNSEMMALGARGVTICFASGDGSYNVNLNYPASSPVVTAVGGVFFGDLGYSDLEVDPQTTGGFSSLSANTIPPYQKNAVGQYVETKGQRPAHFNTSRRAVPDIAAFSSAFYIVQEGQNNPVGGTSAATPVSCGVFSMVNDRLLNRGMSPLGFANPLFYQNAHVFLDVVHGNNRGFAAVKGYDPASGLGTFSPSTFENIVDAAASAQMTHRRNRNGKASPE